MRKLALLWPICLGLGCAALPRQAEPADPAAAPLQAAADCLERGDGLLLLATQLFGQPEPADGDPDPQVLLFQAAAELDLAAEQNPDAARPAWYLYEVWSQLGQQLPARRSLTRAHDRAELSDLTP